ncbi:glycosyltransferase family 2 protein [Pseudoalteromonas sp. SWXJ133]|uniref:glycosyltransferase family 2 protein n=1 Tax=Pseudoalteromonas sp. SWXJ133 TaxID=2792069 RepID=UPI0018CEE225|nr:glycosyltransferase family 2 protein [Pseudoalteromonas sp. SWXJ133]MBH0019498.1 glycosyltransferase family 2 protein [Pseudoalteromonas sp. SWXJ133]
MQNNIKFSLVMPLFNSEKWMDKSIKSVLSQSYQSWELICVDDGSHDDTVKKVELFKEHSLKIKLLKQKNSGPAVARETAITVATGDYIVFLDSDDYIESEYLEKIIELTSDYPDVIIPELMSQTKDSEFYSFNKVNKLVKGMSFTGKQAFRLTFPWSIHGFACYKTELMKQFAIGDNANYTNYNADEYITRVVFLNSQKIVISDGKYFHTANLDSLTKIPSVRMLGFLLTEKKLIKLTELNDPQFLTIVKSDSLRKIFNSYLNFCLNAKYFTAQEIAQVKSDHKALYKEIVKKNYKYLSSPKESILKKLIYKIFSYNFDFIKLIIFARRLGL